MGTTTNNGWTYPESTDLVKDGATAIQTLADDIDTTLGVYAPSSSGLTLINTTSFSGVSSQSVNNVFSATYANYLITFNAISTASSQLTIRFRTAGTDNTATTYKWGTFAKYFNSATLQNESQSETATSIPFADNSTYQGFSFTLINPFATDRTFLYGGTITKDDVGYTSVNGFFDNTTSFDGFTFFTSTGTTTGTVRVYGYQN